MPFREVFERRVNREMSHRGQEDAGPSSRRPSSPQDTDKSRCPRSPTLVEQDLDYDEPLKKETSSPPRFSTLFPPTQPPARAAEPTIVYQQAPSPAPCTKRGITLSLPIFILFIAIIFFESTLLFAYTVIGLYNNMPGPLSQFLPHGQCNNIPPQTLGHDTSAVNNNFYLGGIASEAGGLAPGLGKGSDSNLVLDSVLVSATTSSSTSTSTTATTSTTSTTSSSSASTSTTLAPVTKVFTETSVHILPPSATVISIVTAAPASILP